MIFGLFLLLKDLLRSEAGIWRDIDKALRELGVDIYSIFLVIASALAIFNIIYKTFVEK